MIQASVLLIIIFFMVTLKSTYWKNKRISQRKAFREKIRKEIYKETDEQDMI
jgi:hypothetical protein